MGRRMLQEMKHFWKDEQDQPIWKDTYVYAMLNEEHK